VTISLFMGMVGGALAAENESSSILDRAKQDRLETLFSSAIERCDSLLNSGSASVEDQGRAWVIKGTCLKKMEKNVQALAAFKSAIELDLEQVQVTADAYAYAAEIYHEQRSPALAVEYYARALDLYSSSKGGQDEFRTHIKLGRLYESMYLNEDALLHYERAFALIPKYEVTATLAELHSALGRMHFGLVQLDEAEAHLTLAHDMYKELQLPLSQNDVSEQLIGLYKSQREYGKALIFATSAYESALGAGNHYQAINYLAEVAFLHEKQRNFNEAIERQEAAVKMAREYHNQSLPHLILHLGELYHKAGRSTDALVTYHDALKIADDADLYELERQCCTALMNYYESHADLGKALYYSQKSDSLSTLVAVEQHRALAQEINRNKLDEYDIIRDKEAEIMQLQAKQSTLQKRLLIGGVIGLSLVLFLIYREFIQKRKLSKVLEWKVYKRTRELRKVNKELNTYIYKSSHDLRTPLTSIKSLLRLLQVEEHNATTTKYLGLIDSCAEQMDDILINLSRAVDYKKVEVKKEKIDFKRIEHEIRTKELNPDTGVQIVWEVNEKAPFYTDNTLLKVILNKTISNAISYRQGTRQDFCKVTITTDSRGAILAIEDNGQGISEKVRESVFDMFVKGTNKSKGAGLGLYLAKIAVEKLKGHVTLESQINKGSRLVFEIPNMGA
jgi:signal transduction histidine kinase